MTNLTAKMKWPPFHCLLPKRNGGCYQVSRDMFSYEQKWCHNFRTNEAAMITMFFLCRGKKAIIKLSSSFPAERPIQLPMLKVKVSTFPVKFWPKHLNWQLKVLHIILYLFIEKMDKIDFALLIGSPSTSSWRFKTFE